MQNDFLEIIYFAVCLIISVIIHEIAHGWVANKLGDPTARLEGRLSLNPLKHIDPFGSVVLPLFLLLSGSGFVFGWAKPVPVDGSKIFLGWIDKPWAHSYLHSPRSALLGIGIIFIALPLLFQALGSENNPLTLWLRGFTETMIKMLL